MHSLGEEVDVVVLLLLRLDDDDDELNTKCRIEVQKMFIRITQHIENRP